MFVQFEEEIRLRRNEAEGAYSAFQNDLSPWILYRPFFNRARVFFVTVPLLAIHAVEVFRIGRDIDRDD